MHASAPPRAPSPPNSERLTYERNARLVPSPSQTISAEHEISANGVFDENKGNARNARPTPPSPFALF